MGSDVFTFDLPSHLIAQYPCEPRDQSRLLAVNRQTGTLNHRRFCDLPELLHPGDLLVLNDTRVLHARLIGRRAATGGKWEGLFLRSYPDGAWEMLCQTGGRLREGEIIAVEHGGLELTIAERLGPGQWLVQPNLKGDADHLLEQFGHVPLPPYIRKGSDQPLDRERYQTVYAATPGAVAAPTAGLHFTPSLFENLKRRGLAWTHVTLHVGLGTFQPMQSENPDKHKMHAEWGRLPQTAVRAIEECKQRGGRVIAVGTTSVRVLESVARRGPLTPWNGETDLFIYPPYDFRVVDALITNFHLPGTTLLLLVAAFAGVDLLAKAYKAAVAESYRFYSYGDAMLVSQFDKAT